VELEEEEEEEDDDDNILYTLLILFIYTSDGEEANIIGTICSSIPFISNSL
jgi:hypothetical protein